jgi:hypothetical protein
VAKGLALLHGNVLFHCLFTGECNAESLIVDSIYFSVIAYVNAVYLMAIPRSTEGARWQTDSSGMN